ncbi:MAG TPA: prepilin-type cleavage/methylation domain-containing protein [Methylophilus sp.]|nr:prepilin-type cleavage/methylation domain-containing protein [Methylophilus sp.]HQQ33708.1 prepilin-type cleavage/methylation domain-containing protein [Methylophilus sp.]
MAINRKHTQQGAVLLEALIAVLVFSFGILAISGLQGAMMKNTADATFRAEASYIVQQRMGEMLSNPVALGGYVNLPVNSLPNGMICVIPISEGRLLYRITWGEDAHDCDDLPLPATTHRYEAVTSIVTAGV